MEKLNFETFTECIAEKIKEGMQGNIKVDIHETKKNNEVTYKAISVMREDSCISPNLKIENYYNEYVNGKNIDEVVADMIDIFSSNHGSCIDINHFTNYESAKNNLMIKLIAYEKNEERLKKIPYNRFLDLAIIYYYHVPTSELNASIQIENEHLDMWNITVDELHQVALKNSMEKLPVRFQTIGDIISNILMERGADVSCVNEDIHYMEKQVPMFVLSNVSNYFGAAVLYYPDVLKHISKEMNGDYIVLPSSIHEVIVLPVSGEENFAEINEMIHEINVDQVADEEILADHLYYYDSKKEKLMIPSLTL